MRGLETLVKSNLVRSHESRGTPVWGNHRDSVAGRYASGEETICEVLDPLGPATPSVLLISPQQENEDSPHRVRIFDGVLIRVANSNLVGLNKGSTKKKLDRVQRRGVDRQPRWQLHAVADIGRGRRNTRRGWLE